MKTQHLWRVRWRTLLTAPALICLFSLYLAACSKKDKEMPVELTITSFSPAEAAEGAAVVLKGTGFPTDKSKLAVKFNGASAVITGDPTATELTVTVPEGATTGKISITANEKTVTTATDFKVNPTAPVITAFTPDKGDAALEVTITGNRFTESSEVFFGGVKATEVTFVSKTSIKAKVPAGALTGKIKVTANGLEALSTTDFKVRPAISSLSTNKAEEGAEIEINGVNFSSVKTENAVFFGTVRATTTVEATSTKLKVKVPAGAELAKIRVVVADLEASSAADFYLLPTITQMTPKRGARGSEVDIYGKNFVLSDVKVYYKGVQIGGYGGMSNSTVIKFNIPTDALDGSITLVQYGITKELGDFQVTNCWQQYQAQGFSGINDGSLRVADGNKIIWGYGFTGGSSYGSEMHAYDISTKTYTKLKDNVYASDAPTASSPIFSGANGKIFFHSTGHIYDIATNKFSPFGGGYYPDGVAFRYNNETYFYRGYGGKGYMVKFTPDFTANTGSYTIMSTTLPESDGAQVEVVGDTAYVIGGYYSTTGEPRQALAVSLKDFGYKRIDLSAVMTYHISRGFLHFHKDNMIYFGGGYENNTVGRNMYSLNITTREVKKIGTIPVASTTVPMAYIDDKAYVVSYDGVYFYRPQ